MVSLLVDAFSARSFVTERAISARLAIGADAI